MSEVIDLTNQRFSKLVVLERDFSKTKRVYWLCKCDCGNTTSVASNKLLAEITKSCGCLRKEINHFVDYPDSIAAITLLFIRYKTDARVRNKEFKLSRMEFEYLITQNCHYCNEPPNKTVQRKNRKDKYKIYNFKYNGIDRKDNNVGYLTYNCVSCCSVCNRAKDVLSVKEFAEWLQRASATTLGKLNG